MNRAAGLAIGAVLLAIGLLFFLQGIDVLGGSGMSGESQWAVIGAIMAVAGIALLGYTFRRTPPA